MLFSADLQPNQPALDWGKRMKIALHAARGLEYLHDQANPPVIYRDLKSSNILLDDEFNGKLSDFGLAKVGPVGDNSHVSSRIMGTYGYCAPEYQKTGHLSIKSDVYSFGVVLLEIITAKRAVDPLGKGPDQMLVSWVSLLLNREIFYFLKIILKIHNIENMFIIHSPVIIKKLLEKLRPIFQPLKKLVEN